MKLPNTSPDSSPDQDNLRDAKYQLRQWNKPWLWIIVGVVALLMLAAVFGNSESETGTPRPASSSASVSQPAPTPVTFPTRVPASVGVSSVPAQHILALEPVLDQISESVNPTGLNQGHIYNEFGDQCRYVQRATHRDSPSYFDGDARATDTIMVFSDPKCMTPDVLGIGYLQEQVTVTVAKWYSNSDAAFKTAPSDLTDKFFKRANGWCIQSETYPLITVLIDYFVDGESLAAVLHAQGPPGCE